MRTNVYLDGEILTAEYQIIGRNSYRLGRIDDWHDDERDVEIISVYDENGYEIDPVELGIEDEIEYACLNNRRI